MAISLDFNEDRVMRYGFPVDRRDPETFDPREEDPISKEMLVCYVSPRGAPRCYSCRAPALWQDEGAEVPVRRVPGLTAEFIYSHSPESSWLQFFGVYITDDLMGQLAQLGWTEPEFADEVRMPDDVLTPETETTTLNQPAGSALFGGQTPDEGLPRLDATRRILAACGVPLAGPRMRTLAESM
jgi:hypothetical protein